MILFLASLIAVTASFTWSAEPFYLISGFDDVLKQAENQNLAKAALRLFKEDKTFTGMPELYRGMTEAQNQDTKFFLVSGTSRMFLKSAQKLLTESKFPKAELYFRSWLTEWNIKNFKIGSIQKALGPYPNMKMVVIFDNSGASQELTRLLPERFPERVLAIYLRETVRRPTVLGAVQFTTAFDVGLKEWQEGRMTLTALGKIEQAILNEENAENLIPKYAFCPMDYDPCVNAELTNCHSVRTKVQGICRSRQ